MKNLTLQVLLRTATILIFLGSAAPVFAVTKNFELYGIRESGQVQVAKDMGFTQVILDHHALATEAASLGLSSTLANWWGVDTSWEVVEHTIQDASTLPAVVAVNMVDEPMYNGELFYPLHYYQDLQPKIKAVAPDIKLSLTEYGPQLEWSPTKLDTYKKFLSLVDIIRLDVYPIAGKRELRTVFDWLHLCREMMLEINHVIPVTVILQAWNSGDEGEIEMPSVPQMRVMAFLAFFGGADTISFFEYNIREWNKIPGFQQGLTELVAELKDLSVHYRDWSIDSRMSLDGVLTATATNGSQSELITINTKTLNIDQH